MMNGNVQEGQLYTPVRGRKNKKGVQKPQQLQNYPQEGQQQNQKQKQKQEQQQPQYQSPVPVPPAPAVPLPLGNGAQDDPSRYENQPYFAIKRSLGVARHFSDFSNLGRVVVSTTPIVPAKYIAKTTMVGWQMCDVEYLHYFTLKDLWASFSEWSVYGAEVPIYRIGVEGTKTYYVPYLSGIQLYGPSAPADNADSRRTAMNNDCAGSSRGGVECVYYTDHRMEGVPVGRELFSSVARGNQSHEGSSSDDADNGNSESQLLFEYFETHGPHLREPLFDKVASLTRVYPGLNTLRSCDLVEPSWVSVAWYPIYTIPAGPICRDLGACFLTYHYLSVPSKGLDTSPTLVHPVPAEGVPRFILPSFGLAFFKFGAPTWVQSSPNDYSLACSLMQSTSRWLNLLGVNHPDMKFFIRHGPYYRKSSWSDSCLLKVLQQTLSVGDASTWCRNAG